MKKISLRMCITLFTGVAIIITSLISGFFAMHNYQRSLDNVKSVIGKSVVTQQYFQESDKSDESKSQNIGRYDISGYAGVTEIPKIKNDLATYNAKLCAGIAASDEEFISSQIMSSLIMTVIGMLVAYVVSGLILKPIRQLSEDVSQIGSIEKAHPLAIYNEKDEIGVLTKTFNDFIMRGKNYSYKQKLFASNVAHELKTPLAIMKASIQIVDEDSTIEEYQEVFALQEKNIDRLTNIINDLLVLRDNNLNLKKQRIDEIMLTVINENQNLLSAKNIEVIKDMEKLLIETDESLIHRLLSNIFTNAIKYNYDSGKIYVEVHDNYLSIRDTGIGMEEKYFEDIFEPLFCIDKSRSKDLGGTGLGLSIVKNIADSLGYAIKVNSKVGCGSEFVIYFLPNKDERTN